MPETTPATLLAMLRRHDEERKAAIRAMSPEGASRFAAEHGSPYRLAFDPTLDTAVSECHKRATERHCAQTVAEWNAEARAILHLPSKATPGEPSPEATPTEARPLAA